MDLLSIFKAVWRHKLLTVPIILLTLFGAFYTIGLATPTYQLDVDFALVAPPSQATSEAVAADPALAHISPNNPFNRFTDQSVVVDILASTVSADPIHAQLVAKGANPKYSATPSTKFGSPTPIADVKGVGSSPAAATKTANLVSQALTQQLYAMQQAQGVNPYYMFKVIQLDHNKAVLQVSSKLRCPHRSAGRRRDHPVHRHLIGRRDRQVAGRAQARKGVDLSGSRSSE